MEHMCVQLLREYVDRPFAFPSLMLSPFAFEDIPQSAHARGGHSHMPAPPAVPPKRLSHSEVLPNFAKLLQFWGYALFAAGGHVCFDLTGIVCSCRVYYTTRARDQRGLSTSSGFRFPVWQHAVNALLLLLSHEVVDA
jgi:hypothetical protein